MTLEEAIGVECGLCHEEAFQLVLRKVTHEVKVCPRCARRVDGEQEERMAREAASGLSRSERRRIFQEQSYEWANKLHGKKVIVHWDDNTHPTLIRHYEKHVKGTAYRTTNECSGWGKVKIVIDSAEYHRISVSCRYTLYCEIAQNDMFFASAPLPPQCWGIKCQHQTPVMDGQRFGLSLNADDGAYYTLVSWRCRKCLILDTEAHNSEKFYRLVKGSGDAE